MQILGCYSNSKYAVLLFYSISQTRKLLSLHWNFSFVPIFRTVLSI